MPPVEASHNEHTQQLDAREVAGLRKAVPTPVSDSHRPVVFSLTDNAYGPRIVEGPSRWPISTLTTRVTRLDGRPFTLGPVVPGEVHVMAVPPGYGQ